ncbi:MAG: glycosyltransferase family 2 protein [Flavobacteriaceae bacterium]
MKIAVVILNWNGQQLLQQFLPSILQHSKIAHCAIYVADNASTDDSIAIVRKEFPSVHIVQNTENGGYAKGYNDALKNIDADVFTLVNSDIEVTENWLSPIVSEFKTNENTAIIQPKILSHKNKENFEYAGAGGGFIDKYGFPFCRGRIFNHLEKDSNQYNDTQQIFWASGACLFIRSSVFKELNGFDEQFFAHQEEIDLCWRTHNLGYQIKYIGTSTVYHIGGATLKESNPHKTFLNFRNSLFVLAKNLPKKSLFPRLFIRLVFDGVAGVFFFLRLKPIHTFAIIKAHFNFYAGLRGMLRKRNTINKEDYYYTKSIVCQHFIKGVKLFNGVKKV